jgi:large subunit ribosomal protein L13
MLKTYVAKKKDIKRKWYIVDAQDKVLGRLASQIASILRGKHKPIFTPNIDTGDGVIVINARKIKLTGKKMKEKLYRSYSGYPDGLKEKSLETLLKEKPTEVLKLAVKRMLPKGPLGRQMFRKLKVYAGPEHAHSAQKPELLEVE